MSIERIVISALLLAGLAGAAAAQGTGAGAGTGTGMAAGPGTPGNGGPNSSGLSTPGQGFGGSNTLGAPGGGFGGTGAPGVQGTQGVGSNQFTVPFGFQGPSSNVQPMTPNAVQQTRTPGAFQPPLPNAFEGQAPATNPDVNGLPPSVVPNR